MFSLLLCFGNCQIKVLAMLINNNRPGAYTLLNWNEWLTNVGHSLNLVLKRCKLKVETIYHFSFNEKESVSFDPTTKFLPKKFVEAVASFRLNVGTGLSLFTLKGEPPHKVNIHPSFLMKVHNPHKGMHRVRVQNEGRPYPYGAIGAFHLPINGTRFTNRVHSSRWWCVFPTEGTPICIR